MLSNYRKSKKKKTEKPKYVMSVDRRKPPSAHFVLEQLSQGIHSEAVNAVQRFAAFVPSTK